MKIIMGIVAPTSGKIIFDETDITDYTITDRAKLGMAYAFQTPIRFKGIKVSDLLDTAQKTNSKIMEVCNYLSKVGLCAREYIDRELDGSLSGGELKRIEIATTLARGAKINIFDEPEAGIDLWSFDGLIAAFNENKEIYKTTNIIISHQEKLINIADKILVLNGGKVKHFDTKDIVLPLIQESKTPVCNKINQGVINE